MRKVVDLDPGLLDAAPEHLRECLSACTAPVAPAAAYGAEAARERKRIWLHETSTAWGTCGQAVLVDARIVGAVLYAPESFLPGLATLPTAPVSPDAVAMASVLISGGYDVRGVGRLLVQAMARDLLGRYATAGPIRAVEAICGQADPCAPRAAVCASAGFRDRRAHPAYPRMRLELRGCVSWRGELEQALGRLKAGVRVPAAPPGRVSPGRSQAP